jgi:hypothetical protein
MVARYLQILDTPGENPPFTSIFPELMLTGIVPLCGPLIIIEIFEFSTQGLLFLLFLHHFVYNSPISVRFLIF